jgi:hypothetical protein
MGSLMSFGSSAIWRATNVLRSLSAGVGSESCKPASLPETMLLPSMQQGEHNGYFGHRLQCLKRRSITSMLHFLTLHPAIPPSLKLRRTSLPFSANSRTCPPQLQRRRSISRRWLLTSDSSKYGQRTARRISRTEPHWWAPRSRVSKAAS